MALNRVSDKFHKVLFELFINFSQNFKSFYKTKTINNYKIYCAVSKIRNIRSLPV